MNIAFVDMTFHIQNTKSSQFFIEILKPLGNIHHISNVDAWRIVPELKPDIVIIWQLLLSPEEIDFFGVSNVVLIPMYDACPHSLDFWNKYKKYKIFCFSKTLYEILNSENFNCLYSQYYIKPNLCKAPLSNAFFWERYDKLNWNTIKNLCSRLPIRHLHYHTGLSQNNSARPEPDEIEKYNITFSSWFNDKSEMDEILDNSGLYISPRKEEGIGLSFIEAISRGNVIAAYDAPTMNEYIENGIDGILFSENTFPKKTFSLAQLKSMQKKSIKKAAAGYEAWENSLDFIRNFITKPLADYIPKKTLKGFLKYAENLLKYIIKKIIRWNR